MVLVPSPDNWDVCISKNIWYKIFAKSNIQIQIAMEGPVEVSEQLKVSLSSNHISCQVIIKQCLMAVAKNK